MRIKQAVVYPAVKPPDMNLEALFKVMVEVGYPAVEIVACRTRHSSALMTHRLATRIQHIDLCSIAFASYAPLSMISSESYSSGVLSLVFVWRPC